jgi:hypothetical protein
MSSKNIGFLALIIILTVGRPGLAQPESYQPIFHITGQTPTSYIGSIIANFGDQNGDGCDEFLVSSFDPSGVYMFYGGNPPDTIPDMIFGAGYGSPRSITYGENVRSHEYGSLLICMILNGYMKLYLYDCGNELDTTYDMVFQDEQPQYSDGFGYHTSIGDVNGDGWNDIVTSAQNYGSASQGFGKLYVFFGGPDMDNIPDFTITAMYNNFGQFLGEGLDCGDVNGDGYADILAMTASPRKAYVFYGGAEMDSIPDWSYQAVSPIYLTTLCTIVPNLNGDQYADIILEPSNSPESYVFFGDDSINNLPDQIINPSVGMFINIGDLDYDGYSDVLGRNEVGSIIRPLYGGSLGLTSGAIINTQYEPETIGYCGDINADIFDDISYATYYPNYFGQAFIYSDTTLTPVEINFSNTILPFELLQNYPNPFNKSTTINFSLNYEQNIKIQIFDITGRLVQEIFAQSLPAGSYKLIWNAENLSSGIYFIQLKSENQSVVKPIEILK